MTRVAVIMGGWSSERPVSLSSGKGMAEAARQSGFDVVEIDVTRQLAQQLDRGEARRGAERPARPLGRGWLRAGRP